MEEKKTSRRRYGGQRIIKPREAAGGNRYAAIVQPAEYLNVQTRLQISWGTVYLQSKGHPLPRDTYWSELMTRAFLIVQ